jgi:pimeloyl-ACP methyl ester carboxylesterase
MERPQDVKFLLDRLLAESQKKEGWLFETIDADSVGVLGHSFGGLTSCQAAARDPRVKAVLPMTLAISETFSTPLFLMIGEKDRTVGEAGNIVNRVSFAGAAGPKYLLSLKRGGHFSFSEMDVINPSFGDGIGTETRKGQKIEYLDSALTREIIDAYSLAFFDFYLRKDPRAGEYLKTNHYPAEMDLVSEPARR